MGVANPIIHRKLCRDDDEVGLCFFCGKFIRKGDKYVMVIYDSGESVNGLCFDCAQRIGTAGGRGKTTPIPLDDTTRLVVGRLRNLASAIETGVVVPNHLETLRVTLDVAEFVNSQTNIIEKYPTGNETWVVKVKRPSREKETREDLKGRSELTPYRREVTE